MGEYDKTQRFSLVGRDAPAQSSADNEFSDAAHRRPKRPAPSPAAPISPTVATPAREKTKRLRPGERMRTAAMSALLFAFAAGGAFLATGVNAPAPARTTLDPPVDVKSENALPEIKLAPSILHSLGDFEYAMAPRTADRIVRVQRGETLQSLLTRAGVERDEAQSAITAISGVFDARKLREGQKMAVTFGVLGSDQGRFLGIKFDSAFDRTVFVQRQRAGDFVGSEVKKKIDTELTHGTGEVDTSLFQAGLAAGVPASIMIQLIHLYSYDVDFQRDIQPKDGFQMLYETSRDEKGQVVRFGEVLFTSLTLQGKSMPLYRFTPKDGSTDYFNERGESVKKALLRTPIDGARLTSGFGLRQHPILGYTKLHRGVDFAAPQGTPIYAAGDGSIEKAGPYGGYGNYVQLKHNSEYSTGYAHMSRIAPGLFSGKRVKQGQIIGYVGTTGMSTGPHLHYEVMFRKNQINPMSLKLPTGQKLAGKDLERFVIAKKRLDDAYVALVNGDKDKIAGLQLKILPPTVSIAASPCSDDATDPINGRAC